jgi:tetratricopeptide (TPR) repeat protein
MPVDDPGTVSAIRRHEERLQRDPTSLAFAQLADLYRKAGRAREAAALCREGLVRYPQYTTARLILVKALMDEGHLDEALSELTGVLASSPGDVQSHRLAADLQRRRGQFEQAVRHLETALELDPDDREARALLGVLRGDGPAPDAGGLGRALADDTFVTMTFGTTCLEQGLAEEAAQVFGRLVRKEPENVQARERLEQALQARLRRRG